MIILEELKTKNLTRKAKPKPNLKGRWDKNNAKAKAGLNTAILDKGWHQFEVFVNYKADKAGEVMFKAPAPYTSQACSACGHTRPNNRKNQSDFICEDCGYSDNADRNAAINIKQQAIQYFTNSGTELSKKGVLTSILDKGRGAKRKSKNAKAFSAVGCESPKKRRTSAIAIAC